jgi:hypothetical protein
MFSLANTYAKLKKTTIIAYDLKEDGTIVFVIEAGGKYKMTKDELEKAIKELAPTKEQDLPLPGHLPAQAGTGAQAGVSEPFQYIEEAVQIETPQPKRRTKK